MNALTEIQHSNIRSIDDLVQAAIGLTIVEGLTGDDLKAAVSQSGSRANMIKRMARTYNRAEIKAKRHGFVGVGCITFAESRLAEFQRRASAVVGLPQ